MQAIVHRKARLKVLLLHRPPGKASTAASSVPFVL
jgi:hypothetical protein